MSSLKKPPARPAARDRAEQQALRRHERLEALAALDCLRGVPNADLMRLADLCTLRAFPAGTTLISYGSQARHLFLVERGDLQLRLRHKDGQEILMGFLGRGDCCGEGTLFGDLLRSVGATAQSDCTVLQVPLADLRAALPAAPGLAGALRHVYTRRLAEIALARVPVFSRLSPAERAVLASLVRPAHFPRGSQIISEGQPGTALYIIEAGQVSVEQRETTVATLKEGSFFGEMALLSSSPHGATIRAITPTDVLALPAAELHRLLSQRPDLEGPLRLLIEERARNSSAARSDAARAREVVVAIERGLLRGNHLLVRNPDLCPPDCRICEQACLSRHGAARLHLNGTRLGELDVVDACRQCSVGAECVDACPEDALEWTERGALTINQRCTGCGACVSACPYGVIEQVSRGRPEPDGPLWRLFRALRRPRSADLSIPLEPAGGARRAEKCDLCHGHADLACLSACPTGSLRLASVEELFPL